MKKILITTTVVIAAGAAAPYFIGMQAEKQFAHHHNWLQQEVVYPQLSIESGEFKRGWLNSESSTRFTITPTAEDAEPVTFELVHHISQIPSPTAMMTVESELVLPPEATEKLKAYFADQALFSATTDVGYGGGTDTQFSSPGYSGKLTPEDDTQLDWQGLSGTLATNGRDELDMTLAIPGMKLQDDDGKMQFSNLNYSTQLALGAHELWFGTAEASLDGMLMDITTPQNGPTRMQLDNMQFNSEQREDGERVDIDGKLSFDKVEVNGFGVSNGIYDTGYHNLDAASLGALNRVVKKMARSDSPNPDMMMAEVFQHMQQLLSRQPELHVRQLQVDTPMGQVKGEMKVVLTEALTPVMLQDPRQLLDVLNADLEASLPKVMLEQMFSSSARTTVMRMASAQGRELSPEELQQQVDTFTERQIQGLLAQKLMVENGDNYATVVNYTPHTLMINEQDATPMISGMLQQ